MCNEIGKENSHSHSVEDCWANPYSSRYRKNTYEARLLECLRAGKPIPKLMQVYAKEAKNFPATKAQDESATEEPRAA